MNLHNNLESINFNRDAVVTIGNFDGVHKGHIALLKKTVELAKTYNMKSVVFTFENHPLEFIYHLQVDRLNSDKKKLEILKKTGIQEVVSIPFNQEIMDLSTEAFAQKVLVDKLRAKHVVMGFDSRLGTGQEGKVDYLKVVGSKLGFEVHIIPPVLEKGLRISSSYIRELIKKGDIEGANLLLNYPYEIQGVVVHGKKLGRKLGFPTANLMPDTKHTIPQKGVYYGQVVIDGKIYEAAISVGDNPTIQDKGFSIEAYILDFDEEIYGQSIRLIFLKKLRDEMKFSSLEELTNQMQEDVKRIKNKALLDVSNMVK